MSSDAVHALRYEVTCPRVRRKPGLSHLSGGSEELDFASLPGPTLASCRFILNDRILWRDPCGIGGLLVAATIERIRGWKRDPLALLLNIEASEPARMIAEWAALDTWCRGWPHALDGHGGRIAIRGDDFCRAVIHGKLWLAAEDDDGRARETASLAEMPDWWSTRHQLRSEDH